MNLIDHINTRCAWYLPKTLQNLWDRGERGEALRRFATEQYPSEELEVYSDAKMIILRAYLVPEIPISQAEHDLIAKVVELRSIYGDMGQGICRVIHGLWTSENPGAQFLAYRLLQEGSRHDCIPLDKRITWVRNMALPFSYFDPERGTLEHFALMQIARHAHEIDVFPYQKNPSV